MAESRGDIPAHLTSFPPVVAGTPRVLILGSMPGSLSLQRNQYYAHPRNGFWPIMGEVCGAQPEWPYEERIARLQEAGIALWDVLKHCDRQGSLDGRIVTSSEEPNDFATFLAPYPSIQAVAFNGRKAEKSFHRHIMPYLPSSVGDRLALIPLPSSSPAHTMPRQAKLTAWRAIQRYL